MNVKRFTARTSREALALVRQAFGEDAVVMSTRPCAEGVEMVAMAPDSVAMLERVGAEEQPPRGTSMPAGTARARLAPRRSEDAAEADSRRSLSDAADARVEPRFDAYASLPGTFEAQDKRREPRADGMWAAGTTTAASGRVDPIYQPTRAPAPGATASDSERNAVRPDVAQDIARLQMSTLSFQDYVRQRMLKRREAQKAAEASIEPVRAAPSVVAPIAAARSRMAAGRNDSHHLADRPVPVLRDEVALPLPNASSAPARAAAASRDTPNPEPWAQPRPAPRPPATLAGQAGLGVAAPVRSTLGNDRASHALPAANGEQIEMMSELRSMRGLIEQRFGALAFMEKLQRHPRQAQLAQRLLDAGFSPALIRKLVTSLPVDVDEQAWATNVLERNLVTSERDTALEDLGGVYAMIGATGVGKTTSTAKLAAAFATRHGAANLGLITLDAYRVAAHEQLRTYGRILGVPVHTAHDRASLEDLLDLLAAKRMVLIDTAGMAQRDSRTRELLDMVSHRAINRVLVVNASAQGETIEDQLAAYAAPSCRGVILSKLDEAVKLGPALDSMLRHKLRVLAVANGQRVPEDWHRLSAHALVQRALRGGGSPAWKLDDNDVSLVFAGMPVAGGIAAAGSANSAAHVAMA
jgi:flagellar biosynthesis protein FlhF